MRIKENTVEEYEDEAAERKATYLRSLSFEDLLGPGHRSGVLLMELMSSSHISKTAVSGGDYQYLLNALFVFIMQPQLILWNNSTDLLCKTEAFGLDMLRHLLLIVTSLIW